MDKMIKASKSYDITKNELSSAMDEGLDVNGYTKISFEQLVSLGNQAKSVVSELKSLFKNNESAGADGECYRMEKPSVDHERINEYGNALDKKGKIVGRAKHVKINQSDAKYAAQINPTVLLITIAIAVITRKLDRIERAQKEILEFLQLKEKAMIKGNIAVLQEILDEYKYNWDNEKYKNNKHIQVQEIKRDAEQSIIFCREKIDKKSSKKGGLHGDAEVKRKIEQLKYEFKDYELAMYTFAFSSLLEIMLLGNFDPGYLNSITQKIKLYADAYRDLYQQCYEAIEGASKTSVQSYVLKGVAGFNKVLGKGLSKIPKIKNGQAEEKLIGASEKVDSYRDSRTEKAMELFVREECTCVLPFIENINAINKIYNEPMEMIFDDENIYFQLSEVTV